MRLTPVLATVAAATFTLAATPAHAATTATTATTEPDGAFRDPATYDLAIAHRMAH